MSDNPLCAMKLPAANSSRSLLHTFLVTLVFCPSIFHPLAFSARTLPSSSMTIRFLHLPTLFRVPCSVFFAWIHQFWSLSVPEHLLNQTNASPSRSTLLTISCPSLFGSPLAATLVPHMFFACPRFCCFLRISYTDMCLLPHATPHDASSLPLFAYESPLLFWLRSEFFTIFPFLR